MKEIEEQQQRKRQLEDEIEEGKRIERANRSHLGGGNSETESEDDDDDNYGPTPIAGVWAAGGSKLERLATADGVDEGEIKTGGGGGDSETEDDDDDDNNEDTPQQPTKKLRTGEGDIR